MNQITQFKTDLIALGLKSGDTVMMHCSYKALGAKIPPDKLFDCFFEILGKDGTLILPAFSYNTVDFENPVFDRENTPSCVGFLPEYFRTEVPNTVRSMHATHSCCVKGKLAKELIENHESDLTPVGENSPITKLPLFGGKILILGSHPDHNTAMHGVEEKGNVPYVLNREHPIHYILRDREKEIEQTAFRHYFNRDGYRYTQEYHRILNLLQANKDYTNGKILNADSYLFDAKSLWEKGLNKIKEDPYYFVEKEIF